MNGTKSSQAKLLENLSFGRGRPAQGWSWHTLDGHQLQQSGEFHRIVYYRILGKAHPSFSEWRLSVKKVFPRPFLLCEVGATKSGGTDGTRMNLKSREFLALLQK